MTRSNSEIARTVFVVSDLHLGGAPPKPPPRLAGNDESPKTSLEHTKNGPENKSGPDERGFRMMTCPQELAAFIDYVASQPRSELVINGDFIDFLAEEQDEGKYQAFLYDEDEAVDTFYRVAGHRGIEPESERKAWDPLVFDALERLLKAGRPLTILLGNHDLELSLPRVREALVRRLGGGLVFLRYDNEGLALGRDVLIEHGNLYDRANAVDHNALRRFRMELTRRTASREHFTPPPGSRLVAEIMNPRLKKPFPFVDLLKPESDALFALLLALAPECRNELVPLTSLLLGQPLSPGKKCAERTLQTALAFKTQVVERLSRLWQRRCSAKTWIT